MMAQGAILGQPMAIGVVVDRGGGRSSRGPLCGARPGLRTLPERRPQQQALIRDIRANAEAVIRGLRHLEDDLGDSRCDGLHGYGLPQAEAEEVAEEEEDEEEHGGGDGGGADDPEALWVVDVEDRKLVPTGGLPCRQAAWKPCRQWEDAVSPRHPKRLLRSESQHAAMASEGLGSGTDSQGLGMEPEVPAMEAEAAEAEGISDDGDGDGEEQVAKLSIGKGRDSIASTASIKRTSGRWSHPPSRPTVEARSTAVARHRSQEDSRALRLDRRWRDLFVTHEQEVIADAAAKDAVTQQLCVESNRNMKNNAKIQAMFGTRSSFVIEGQSKDKKVIFSPNGNARLIWDVLGALFILYDLVTIPLDLGWGLNDLYGESIQMGMSACIITFWGLDLCASFNTGYFTGGSLEMRRSKVFKSYLRTWFFFDVTIIMWDIVLVSQVSQRDNSPQGPFKLFRSFRVVRVVRVFRVLKMSKITENLEDLLTTFGVQWMSMVISLVKSLAVIILAAHTNACIWYYLGRTEYESHLGSWIDVFEAQLPESSDELAQQYTKAMYWVLGHMFTGPVDPTMSPQSLMERVFTLCLILSSLFVVGTGVASLTNATEEMSKINAEAINTRRQLQRYLMASRVPRELFTRVIRFALYSHRRRAARSLDSGVLDLLSETLRSELTMNQRRFCTLHPFFLMISELHAEVFGILCNAFMSRVYADGDNVFQAGVLARFFYLTHDGTYKLATDFGKDGGSRRREPMVKIYQAPEWFAEICLFARYVHTSTLQAMTFADAFTLACTDLIECISMSPSCIASAYLYAQDYVGWIVEGPVDAVEDGFVSAADHMPPELAAKACAKVRAAKLTGRSVVTLESPRSDMEKLVEMLELVQSADVMPARVARMLPQVFGELDEHRGIYTKMAQQDERNRVLAAMLSSMWMLQNRYDLFTACQPPEKRMSTEQWEEWQAIVKWADLSPKMVHALLVFLAIRGLGKIKSFAKALPRDQCSPEDVVLHLIDRVPHIVPSVMLLGSDMLNLLMTVLGTLTGFNFPQMLQGENTPYHVLVLQRHVEEQGDHLLKFYLIAMTGVMCGLRGVESIEGSKFLDEYSGRNVLRGIQSLRICIESQPGFVYWSFIRQHAQVLGLPTQDAEELAVARLACLIRASSADVGPLRTMWSKISRSDRRALTAHFMADGITEDAFVFTFLPLFMANAKTNAAVGLHRALLVLIDLLEVLRAEDYAMVGNSRVVQVDLQDIAAFTKEVCSPRVFLATVSHSKLVAFGTEVQVLISAKHKLRSKQTAWEEDPMEMSTMLRRLERKLNALELPLTGEGEATVSPRVGKTAVDVAASWV